MHTVPHSAQSLIHRSLLVNFTVVMNQLQCGIHLFRLFYHYYYYCNQGFHPLLSIKKNADTVQHQKLHPLVYTVRIQYSILTGDLCTINNNPCLPGPGYVCRKNNCSSLLVPHLPGQRHQCQHPQPELPLEAGSGGAAAAPGGTSWRMGPSRCEASQEHHLHISPYREFPQANGAIVSYIVV